MSELPRTTPIPTGLTGASVGGVIGITLWQILSGYFLNVSFVAGLLILTAYMGLCLLLGMLIERWISRN